MHAQQCLKVSKLIWYAQQTRARARARTDINDDRSIDKISSHLRNCGHETKKQFVLFSVCMQTTHATTNVVLGFTETAPDNTSSCVLHLTIPGLKRLQELQPHLGRAGGGCMTRNERNRHKNNECMCAC